MPPRSSRSWCAFILDGCDQSEYWPGSVSGRRRIAFYLALMRNVFTTSYPPTPFRRGLTRAAWPAKSKFSIDAACTEWCGRNRRANCRRRSASREPGSAGGGSERILGVQGADIRLRKAARVTRTMPKGSDRRRGVPWALPSHCRRMRPFLDGARRYWREYRIGTANA